MTGPGHWSYRSPQAKQDAQDDDEKMPYYTSADQEAHIQHRLSTLIEMVRGIDEQVRVRADEAMQAHAVRGAIDGCALELIRIFGLKPQRINITTLPYNKPTTRSRTLDVLEKHGTESVNGG